MAEFEFGVYEELNGLDIFTHVHTSRHGNKAATVVDGRKDKTMEGK